MILAPGVLLLAVGALVATGRLHARRKQPVPAGSGQPDQPEKEKKIPLPQAISMPHPSPT